MVVVVVEHFTVPQVEQEPPSYQHPEPGEEQVTQEVVVVVVFATQAVPFQYWSDVHAVVVVVVV